MIVTFKFWLLGYEFPATLFVFTPDAMYVVTTAKKGVHGPLLLKKMRTSLFAFQGLIYKSFSKTFGTSSRWQNTSWDICHIKRSGTKSKSIWEMSWYYQERRCKLLSSSASVCLWEKAWETVRMVRIAFLLMTCFPLLKIEESRCSFQRYCLGPVRRWLETFIWRLVERNGGGGYWTSFVFRRLFS